MKAFQSPLRYPGGKASLADFVEGCIRENLLNGGDFIEPYAGGAGLSLALLSRGVIERAFLVEKDPLVYAFWKSVVAHPDELCDKIYSIPVTLDAWRRFQKYKHPEALKKYSIVELGLACIFLNRTNFSGILDANPIGGMSQSSDYTLDCRFNKERITKLIMNIAALKGAIIISNRDAITYLRNSETRILKRASLVYIDPPYYGQGKKLYRYYYNWAQHARLAKFIEGRAYPWLISIDAHPDIRALYSSQKVTPIFLKYAVKQSRRAEELIITNLRHLPMIEHEKVAVEKSKDIVNW
jgi:DNA adenine methylase